MKSHDHRIRRILRWLRRGLSWALAVFLLYVIVLLVGLMPVNRGFRSTENGVRIYLISNAVHADIVVPKTHAVKDWTGRFSSFEFGRPIENDTHVALGWGDRGFFLETETWSDLKLATVANALVLPSTSCVHVSFTRPEHLKDAVSVTITDEQYQRLVEYLEATFQKNSKGDFVQIPGCAYSTNDAFFDAHGKYHLFNTCNSWVGGGLRTAGVCTPWFSPMPMTPMLYLHDEEPAK